MPVLFSPARIIALILVLGSCYVTESVLVPVLVSILVATLMDPWVKWMESRGLSRTLAATLSLSIFLCGVGVTGLAVYRTCSHTLERGPEYIGKIRSLTESIDRQTTAAPAMSSVQENEPRKVILDDGAMSWRNLLVRLVGSMFEVISLALFVPLFSFYFLKEKNHLLKSIDPITTSLTNTQRIYSNLSGMIRSFFQSYCIGAVIFVILHFSLFSTLKLHNTVGLALISGFLNLLPLLGSVLALILPVAQGLLQGDSPLTLVLLASGIISFHFVVNNLVLPPLMGSKIDLNNSAILFGLLFWGWMWGALGLFFAIPITAGMKIVLAGNPHTIHLSELLSKNRVQSRTHPPSRLRVYENRVQKDVDPPVKTRKRTG